MTIQTRTLLHFALSCLAAMSALASCVPLPSNTPAFRITTGSEGDQMTVHVEGQAAVFEVNSQTGIGSASAELTSGRMPEKVILRLYLRGLEELDFNYDKTTVTVSVSSHGDYAVQESVRTDRTNGEEAIGQESPHWMNVNVVVPSNQSGSGTSQPEYFEVEAPQDFMKGGYRAFSVHWIDFYR